MGESELVCAVMADAAGVRDVTTRLLELAGVRVDPHAAFVVLLDIPRGFALSALEGAEDDRRYIVVTDNPCPEYLEDLWDLGPAGLLACAHLQLLPALRAVTAGERFRITPDPPTPLTPAQRRVLRLLARGLSNEQIARQLTMQRQTVKNTVAAIYDQLGFTNRNQAVLYYWGILQVFGPPDPDAPGDG